MPQQAIFLEEEIGDKRITVLKSYDRRFAREAFDAMDSAARTELIHALHLEDEYEPDDLASLDLTSDGDVLWEEMVNQAREDERLFSFFVVTEASGPQSDTLFVSPDWPSAEQFAKSRIASYS
jgi:hypothetical protein